MATRKRIYLTLSANASSGFNDLTFKYIFYDTLRQMGHDVVFYPYQEASAVCGNGKNAGNRAISETIFNHFSTNHKQKPFDFFLSYYHTQQVVPELFRRVRELVPCINYTTNFHQIDLYAPLLTEATLSVYVSAEARSYFERNRFNGYYMPFAGCKANLQFNRHKNGRISFVGTSYGPRAGYIWRCLQNNLPVDVYGANWLNSHTKRAALRTVKLAAGIVSQNPLMIDTAYRCMNDLILKDIMEKNRHAIHDPLPDAGYQKLLSESSVVLNFPESRFGHDYSDPRVLIGANLRDFEVPAAGSMLLTQHNREICTFFTEKQEIETFANEWEMVDKARFYLDHPDLVLKIAEAGHNRVVNEHLWEHRFAELLSHLDSTCL